MGWEVGLFHKSFAHVFVWCKRFLETSMFWWDLRQFLSQVKPKSRKNTPFPHHHRVVLHSCLLRACSRKSRRHDFMTRSWCCRVKTSSSESHNFSHSEIKFALFGCVIDGTFGCGLARRTETTAASNITAAGWLSGSCICRQWSVLRSVGVALMRCYAE